MMNLDSFRERLEASLRGQVEAVVEVALNEDHGFEASIVSPAFEGMDEADRQALIWGIMRDAFNPNERKRIDFLFTDAPSERPAPAAAH